MVGFLDSKKGISRPGFDQLNCGTDAAERDYQGPTNKLGMLSQAKIYGSTGAIQLGSTLN